MLGQLEWVERLSGGPHEQRGARVARRFEPHVALVDLLLGGESGESPCARLRTLAPAPRVVLISGAGGISPSVARAAGASGFIAKDSSASEIRHLFARSATDWTSSTAQSPSRHRA